MAVNHYWISSLPAPSSCPPHPLPDVPTVPKLWRARTVTACLLFASRGPGSKLGARAVPASSSPVTATLSGQQICEERINDITGSIESSGNPVGKRLLILLDDPVSGAVSCERRGPPSAERTRLWPPPASDFSLSCSTLSYCWCFPEL